MTNKKKVVYVPKTWKVSYVDLLGNEHKDVTLSVNKEYKITKSNGDVSVVTISGIKREEGKTTIVVKIALVSGTMHTMTKFEHIGIDLDQVVDITPVHTEYVRTKEKREHNNIPMFTFAFDTNYPTQYRISIYAGEFVALAINRSVPTNVTKTKHSIYGHIENVDTDAGIIKFMRYSTNKGVRDVYPMDIAIDELLGVYRYELKINCVDIEPKVEETTEEVAESTEE